MIFDCIVGNPPYNVQQNVQTVQTLYDKFVMTCKHMYPEMLTMIIPSKWMFGGANLDSFRDEMLDDKHMTHLVDYFKENVFDGADIAGGVCYFLWERDKVGKCKVTTYDMYGNVFNDECYLRGDNDDTFIRIPMLRDIKNKIWSKCNTSLGTIIFNLPFKERFPTNYFANTEDNISEQPMEDSYRILGLLDQKRTYRYIKIKDAGLDIIKSYKVFIPKAYGGEQAGTFVSAWVGEPTDICTTTFMVIGYFDNKEEAENCRKYTRTKFFNCMVYTKKNSQQAHHGVYDNVPIQDFSSNSDIDWNGDIASQLYKKYELTDEEIKYIEDSFREPVNE